MRITVETFSGKQLHTYVFAIMSLWMFLLLQMMTVYVLWQLKGMRFSVNFCACYLMLLHRLPHMVLHGIVSNRPYLCNYLYWLHWPGTDQLNQVHLCREFSQAGKTWGVVLCKLWTLMALITAAMDAVRLTSRVGTRLYWSAGLPTCMGP